METLTSQPVNQSQSVGGATSHGAPSTVECRHPPPSMPGLTSAPWTSAPAPHVEAPEW